MMVKQPDLFYKILDYTVEGRSFENKNYDKIRIKKPTNEIIPSKPFRLGEKPVHHK
jgi:hypothetical protein